VIQLRLQLLGTVSSSLLKQLPLQQLWNQTSWKPFGSTRTKMCHAGRQSQHRSHPLTNDLSDWEDTFIQSIISKLVVHCLNWRWSYVRSWRGATACSLPDLPVLLAYGAQVAEQMCRQITTACFLHKTNILEWAIFDFIKRHKASLHREKNINHNDVDECRILKLIQLKCNWLI